MPLIKGKSQKSFVKNLKTEMHAGKPQNQSLAIAYAMKRKAEKKKGYDDGGKVKPSPSPSPAPKSPFEKMATTPVSPSDFAQGVRDINFAKGGEVHSCPSCGYSDGGPVLPGADDAQASMRKAFGYSEGGQIKDNYQPSGKPEVDREFEHELAENASGFMSHEGDMKRPNGRAMFEDERKLNQHGEEEMGPDGAYAEGGFIGSHQGDEHEDDMVDHIMRQKQMSYSKGGQIANSGMDNSIKYDEPNEFDDLVLRNDDMEDADYTGANSGDEIGNQGEDERRSDIVSKIMASRKKKDRNPRPA